MIALMFFALLWLVFAVWLSINLPRISEPIVVGLLAFSLWVVGIAAQLKKLQALIPHGLRPYQLIKK